LLYALGKSASNAPMKIFEKRKADDCRWPLAEFDHGEFLFCGGAIAERRTRRHGLQTFAAAGAHNRQTGGAEKQRQELIAIAAAA
jgi:hypothetical protein